MNTYVAPGGQLKRKANARTKNNTHNNVGLNAGQNGYHQSLISFELFSSANGGGAGVLGQTSSYWIMGWYGGTGYW